MSVWENTEALFQFVYQSNHLEIFRRRKEWFGKMDEMHMALWYIPAGHLPSVAEATERLNHLRNNGETPFSFSFKKNLVLKRQIILKHVKRNKIIVNKTLVTNNAK